MGEKTSHSTPVSCVCVGCYVLNFQSVLLSILRPGSKGVGLGFCTPYFWYILLLPEQREGDFIWLRGIQAQFNVVLS